MKVLSFTSLFPNSANPSRGVFTERRLGPLNRLNDVAVNVVAPVPSFPFAHLISEHYREGRIADSEQVRNGLDVIYPKAIMAPFGGMLFAPGALYRAGLNAAQTLISHGFDFDLIDAHYAYPDGLAAMRIAQRLNKPLVISALGSDVTELPRHAIIRHRIIEALSRASGVICVSNALRDVIVEDLGVAADHIYVAGNGVDLEEFAPSRPALGPWSDREGDKLMLSVGHLTENKGQYLVIEALRQLEGVRLLLVGDGPDRAKLEKLASNLGVGHRVYFAGRIAPEEMAAFYSAADTLVHASGREGWANVLLESLACGTPVVASDIPMNREVLEGCGAARLVSRTPSGIAAGVAEILAHRIEPGIARTFAVSHSWAGTAKRVHQIFEKVLRGQN